MMKKLCLPKRYFQLKGPLKDHYPGNQRYQKWLRFDAYQRKNYLLCKVNCPCGGKDSYLISKVDREGFDYDLVICTTCGLIRADNYWKESNVEDYYQNHYREIYGENDADPVPIFEGQLDYSKTVWDFVSEFLKKEPNSLNVVDIGGGAGGILSNFIEAGANCYLFDYNPVFLKYAKDKGIRTYSGGLNGFVGEEVAPDLVILSHVLEHFADVNSAILKISKKLNIGSMVYVSLPGIDSLKLGRRSYDFLGDIHKPHVYYFSTEVLTNFMQRNGFELLKIDTEINALFKYTGKKVELINHHDIVVSHIESAEIRRVLRFTLLRRIFAFMMPRSLKILIKKLFKIKDEKTLIEN